MVALTASQLRVCFQTYWYVWLMNGISGLLFLGIAIGIAAFSMKKMAKKKAPKKGQLLNRVSSARRVLTPSEINAFEQESHLSGRSVANPSQVGPIEEDYYINPKSNFDFSDMRPIEERYHMDTHGQMFDVNNETRENSAAAAAVRDPDTMENNDEFAQATLETLNNARRQFHSPSVELNDELSQIAQRCAEEMTRKGKLAGSPNDWRMHQGQILGENYTATFQVELTGEKMIRKWMKEGKRYMFGYDGRKDSANFTQLVWRSSEQIGVGRARSGDGNWWYGVVVFYPSGNIPNQYAANVLLPSG